jgi:hypothetical protein
MTARIVEQLRIVTPNRVGMLSEVTQAIAEIGVNIDALCAYETGKKAVFLVITSNNALAVKSLKAKKFEVEKEKVVLIKLENRVGEACEVADKFKSSKINLHYIYGTTSMCGGPNLLVLKTDKNAKAMKILTE